MAKLYFVSLGCDKNRVDAEIMARSLMDGGHVIVAEAAQADCAIVNTCGFIDSAKEEAIEHIFDMVREKEQGAVKAVVVTGCLAQRYGVEIRQRIPEADAVVGLGGNVDICAVVAQALDGRQTELFGAPEALNLSGARALSTPPHYAYLKIAEGCDNHCTFCAIPAIRGRYRSRPAGEIVAEARELAAQGVRELMLIAQDITAYGLDLEPATRLSALLEQLCEIDGLWKIRLLYAYPDRIDRELIETIARQPRIAKYLDIPLQHASAEVLRRMGRFGDRERLSGLVAQLRGAMPEITLRSTLIVGFPGETESQFAELLDFLKETKLERVGCFAYSPEEGTPAARLPGQKSGRIKTARAERLMTLQNEIMWRAQQKKMGRHVEVICDGFDQEREMFACRGEADAPDIDTCIWLPPDADLVPGEIYSVRVTGADGVDLLGEI